MTSSSNKNLYQAKRAIIMAAGKGVRLQPLTLYKPKPLIKVNGKRMIDSVISSLHENNIHEIYVVVGYKKEQFSELEKDHGVKLIENPYYETCNNISSLYVAKEHLNDVIIMDADQIIANSEVTNPFFEKSGYCCFWQEQKTDEWLLTVENDIVTSCSRTGGKMGWELQSVSFWNEEDGAKLQQDLEETFIKNGKKDLFWDDIALFVKPQNYQLGIRQIHQGDIIEIDSYDELILHDSSYPAVKNEKR